MGDGAVPGGGGGATTGDGAVPGGGGGTTMGDGAVPRGGGGITMGDGGVPRGGGATTMGGGLVPRGGGGTVLRGGSGTTTCATAGVSSAPTATHSNVSKVRYGMNSACGLPRDCLAHVYQAHVYQANGKVSWFRTHHANSRISFTSSAVLIGRGLARTGP
jgi:hypothetical protein